MTLKSDPEFEEKLNCGKFSPELLKVKIGTLMGYF